MNDYFFAEVLLRNYELIFLSVVTNVQGRGAQDIAEQFATVCNNQSPPVTITTNDVVLQRFATKKQTEDFRKEKINMFKHDYPNGEIVNISEQDFS